LKNSRGTISFVTGGASWTSESRYGANWSNTENAVVVSTFLIRESERTIRIMAGASAASRPIWIQHAGFANHYP
jgi:hypothetical protein